MDAWTIEGDDSPLVGVALHGGHALRPEVARLIALPEDERRREEDPETDAWAAGFTPRLIARRSRFEVDLNRPESTAVYLLPEHAWGMQVWGEPPPPRLVDASRELYRGFYLEAQRLLQRLVARFGGFVLCNLHSYNHRRGGPDAPPGPAERNPDVNVGTGSIDRERWGPVVDTFMDSLRHRSRDAGMPLEVRENVNFRGGYFPTWVHQGFGESGCAIAVEVKKRYMDEWSGRVDREASRAVGALVRAAAGDAAEALRRPGGGRGGDGR